MAKRFDLTKLSPEQRRENARKGGLAVQASGRAYDLRKVPPEKRYKLTKADREKGQRICKGYKHLATQSS